MRKYSTQLWIPHHNLPTRRDGGSEYIRTECPCGREGALGRRAKGKNGKTIRNPDHIRSGKTPYLCIGFGGDDPRAGRNGKPKYIRMRTTACMLMLLLTAAATTSARPVNDRNT